MLHRDAAWKYTLGGHSGVAATSAFRKPWQQQLWLCWEARELQTGRRGKGDRKQQDRVSRQASHREHAERT